MYTSFNFSRFKPYVKLNGLQVGLGNLVTLLQSFVSFCLHIPSCISIGVWVFGLCCSSSI